MHKYGTIMVLYSLPHAVFCPVLLTCNKYFFPVDYFFFFRIEDDKLGFSHVAVYISKCSHNNYMHVGHHSRVYFAVSFRLVFT